MGASGNAADGDLCDRLRVGDADLPHLGDAAGLGQIDVFIVHGDAAVGIGSAAEIGVPRSAAFGNLGPEFLHLEYRGMEVLEHSEYAALDGLGLIGRQHQVGSLVAVYEGDGNAVVKYGIIELALGEVIFSLRRQKGNLVLAADDSRKRGNSVLESDGDIAGKRVAVFTVRPDNYSVDLLVTDRHLETAGHVAERHLKAIGLCHHGEEVGIERPGNRHLLRADGH